MQEDTELVLHVWPGRWDLPSFTPACLASVLYLQLTMPGKFVVEECTNPDVSPNGQLPYLTHGHASIASFPSIVKYVEALRKRTRVVDDDQTTSPSPSMSAERLAQETAWMAYVSAHLGDLVACSFFTLRHNYFENVRPALSELFPVPQRYYVPDRLRETYRPRLVAADLWTVHAEEAEEEKRQRRGLANNASVHEAFGKEKVLDKARTAFDILTRLLDGKPFFLGNLEPSALDALFAAHILLLTMPPLPNDLLSSLITESYPSLLAHARGLYARTLMPRASHGASASLSSSFDLVEAEARPVEEYAPIEVRSASPPSFSQIISSLTIPFPWRPLFSSRTKGTKSKEDVEFECMRWSWFGLAALGIVGWTWVAGRKIIEIQSKVSKDEDGFMTVGEETDEEGEVEEGGNDEEGE